MGQTDYDKARAIFQDLTKDLGPPPIDPYTEPYKSGESSYWTLRLRLRYGWASSFTSEKIGAVLDLCCGSGWGTTKLLGDPVIGVDVCFDDFELNHYGRKIIYKKADVTKGLPFPEDHFDWIVALGALEHFEPHEMLDLLQEIKRVLKPDGVIVGMIPSDFYPRKRGVIPEHLTNMTLRSWDAQFSQVFDVVEWDMIHARGDQFFRMGSWEAWRKMDWTAIICFSPKKYFWLGIKRASLEVKAYFYRWLTALLGL